MAALMDLKRAPSEAAASEPDKIFVRDVSLRYRSQGKEFAVLQNISLTIKEGEFVTVIGPSGCGKSSLMNLLSDTVDPLSSSVDGTVEIRWQSDVRHRLGYVLQKDTLLPWRTLEANVGVGLEIMGMPAGQRRAEVQAWIDRVGLTGFEQSFPFALSGGMRQRANIIRSLACKPEVVLMDEPFGALDAQTRMVLQQLLVDLWRATKTTIVFVTHDVEESVLLADRVVLLGRRPGMIQRIYEIGIPHPRSVLDVRLSPLFQDLCRTIWSDLKGSLDYRSAS